MKVLLIDGPKAGEVVEIRNGTYAFQVPILNHMPTMRYLNPGEPIWNEPFETVVYTFHRCVVFNHSMMLGSVNPAGPNDWDAFRLLTSDLAKAAVNV